MPDPNWTHELSRLLTLQDANTRTVLLGTGLLGIACGVVGTFAMFRKRALVADAVSHAALPGICFAFLIIGDRDFAAFMVGALIVGLIAAAAISVIAKHTRVKDDAATAIVIGSFFGLGLVLSGHIQRTAIGNRAGIDGFIFGRAAGMVEADAITIAAVAAGTLVVVFLLFKELRLLCFDRSFGGSLGWPVAFMDLALMGLVCLCTIAGLPAVGALLVLSLLIIPGAAARMWSDRLGIVVFLAGCIGGVSGLLGTALSAVLPTPASALTRGWPTGPLIVLVCGFIFLASAMLAPRRGLLAGAARRLLLRIKVARDHALRDAFERYEQLVDPAPGSGDRQVAAPTPDIPTRGPSLVSGILRLRGMARPTVGGLALTDAGWEEARRVTRAHRLWETFLIEHASIASDHVHRDADELEHLIDPSLMHALETRLAEQHPALSPVTSERSRTPHARQGSGVPTSPHTISPNRKATGGGG